MIHNLIWSQDCADEECKSNKNDLILLLLIIESKMPDSTLDPKSILPMMITSRDGNNFELIFFQQRILKNDIPSFFTPTSTGIEACSTHGYFSIRKKFFKATL